MIEISDKHNCCGCYACFNICPLQCIEMRPDEEGFWYPLIDIDVCNDCGLCEKVCPILKEQSIANKLNNLPTAYAAINTNEQIRESSSSGGIFTVLAEYFIANQGVVFGAGFDGRFNVVHDWIEDEEGIDNFRGSKYVQSKIGFTYQEVQGFLKDGRRVLFSGTPCQIAGLQSFLGKNHDDKLLCIDIICHGVPSPKVWQKYISWQERTVGAAVKRIAFRQKNEGWKLFSLSLLFDNDKEYRKNLTKDYYMKGFIRNLFLRPSCHACHFKSLDRLSDITLADLWGIEEIAPDFNDDKGTSLVLVNTQKGQELWRAVSSNILARVIDINGAILHNSSAIKSVDPAPRRGEFFKNIDKLEFDVLVRKHLSESIWDRGKNKIKKGLLKYIRIIK